MQLSVIISTYNRKKILEETLKHILGGNTLFVRDEMEIIIVNDGEDNLEDLSEQYTSFHFRIVKNKGRGLAAGRNTGASLAKGEVLLFYDDDIIPTKEHFIRHLSVHKKFEKAICMAYRIYPNELIKIAEQEIFGRYKLKYEYDCMKGMNLTLFEDDIYLSDGAAGYSCSIKRETYLDVGPFNETFEYAGCEDSEFFHRAKKKGYKLLFDKKNLCYHNELDNFELKRWLWRQSTGIKSAVVMCKLHPEGKAHPTWYTNTPLQWADPFDVKILKIKKWLLSRKLVEKILFGLVWFLEKIKAPDKILFRLYNALWLGNTYRSFREAYKRLFSSEQRPLPPL